MLKIKRAFTGMVTLVLAFVTTFWGFGIESDIKVSAMGNTEILLSQGKTASASSYQTENTVAMGNDGSTSTRWAASSPSMPQWWKVDLGKSYSLSKLVTNWYDSANRYYQYRIEVSTNDSTYTTIVDKTSNTTKGVSTDTFAATGRYVRITITSTSQANGNASAYEFNVYGYDQGAIKPWRNMNDPSATTGTVLTSTTAGNVAYEAYRRDCVQLSATGQYVQYTSDVSANRLTVRYSIPKGSADSTISLYVNGTHRSDIAVTSKRIWGIPASDVAGGYIRYYDETTIVTTINNGDVIKLQKDSGDTLASYYIDFIELENAPNALTMPASGYVSVKTYGGAVGDGAADDANAIINTLNYASANSKSVWLDAGNYKIGKTISVPSGVKVSGAGMWYSTITRAFDSSSLSAAVLLNGSNIVENFAIIDPNANARVNGNKGIQMKASTSGYTVDSIWINYSFGAGIYGDIISNSTIKNCRVRGTYADGIHFSSNSNNITINNNAVRTAGDDSIAIVAYDVLGNCNNVITNNTVECNYCGRGIAILGGDSNSALYNVVEDSAYAAGMVIGVENILSRDTQYCTNFTVRFNHIYRSGRESQNPWGGIWVYGEIDKPMSGQIDTNGIYNEVRNGISLDRYIDNAVTISNNTIDPPGTNGTYIWSSLQSGHNPTVVGNILN